MNVDEIHKGILKGEPRSLAKGITLVEDMRPDKRMDALNLLSKCFTNRKKSIRLAISGVPGAGKSTLIETMGSKLIEEGHKIAVLTIDPTSPLKGGSILGDKTRMQNLSQNENAFIRPSPTSGVLGGVGRRSQEAMILCEAAGYDYIIIETVGVGQSEATVASMVDVFLVLQLPNAGDELQGIKKGILELADIIAISKADGIFKSVAEKSKLEHERSLSFKGSNIPDILAISSAEGTGIPELLKAIENKSQKTNASERQKQWFTEELQTLFIEYAKSIDLPDSSQNEPASVIANRVFKKIIND